MDNNIDTDLESPVTEFEADQVVADEVETDTNSQYFNSQDTFSNPTAGTVVARTSRNGRRTKSPKRTESTNAKKHIPNAIAQKFIGPAVLATTTALMLLMLHIDRILSRTTPTGGDNPLHVWTGDYLRRVLLPEGRLYGWSNDSFAGNPVLSSYFPLPTTAITLFGFVVPYEIAFKIGTVTGLVLLPFAVYRLGKRAELPWPTPMLMGVGVFPFFLARHFKILGGNIMSTMAGEYSFSISLAFAVFYAGSLITLLRTGRGRTSTTLLLACVGLSHIVPSLFALAFTVSCVLFETRRGRWKTQIRNVLQVGIVALLIASYWILPFGANIHYSNSMDYERNERTLATLFPMLPKSSTMHTPADGVWLVRFLLPCAFLAVIVGAYKRNRFLMAFTFTAALCAGGFAIAPRGAMWNNRLLPAWFLCVYVLGTLGSFYAVRLLRELIRPSARSVRPPSEISHQVLVPEISDASTDFAEVHTSEHIPQPRTESLLARITRPASMGAPFVVAFCSSIGLLLSALVVPGMATPFGWANGNYRGNELRPAFKEFSNLVAALKPLPCGRVYGEKSKRFEQYGSSLTMAQLGYWTKSCFQPIEGLYYESSQTTPYHFLTATYLNTKGLKGQRRLPYQTKNMSVGVDRLRKLGAKYAIFVEEDTKKEAASLAGLRFIAKSDPFAIYEVIDNAIVQPLDVEPVVATNAQGGKSVDFVNAGLGQWVRPESFPPIIAETGPASWKRTAITKAPREKPSTTKTKNVPEPKRGDGLAMDTAHRTIAPATLSNIDVGNQHVAFTVDRVGSPVLVRISYYPNWKVDGAQGPYRVGPNFMVVVPTKNNVRLDYRYRTIELVGFLTSAVGLAALLTDKIITSRKRRKPSASHR